MAPSMNSFSRKIQYVRMNAEPNKGYQGIKISEATHKKVNIIGK